MKMHTHYIVGAHGKKTMSSHPMDQKHTGKKTKMYHNNARKGYYKKK